MRIGLIRSFSSASEKNDESEDWSRWLQRGRGEYGWSDLHQKRVVVVLGEAGIGKTLEFQNEVERLQREGKAAFFVPLNQLLDRDSWELVISQFEPRFEQWKQSEDLGYFFFDAVDEARLVSHAALDRALMVIASALRPFLSRVRIAISSRVTDWAVESVRDSVGKHLVGPIEAASREIDIDQVGSDVLSDSISRDEANRGSVDAFVVSLNPLSEKEARKLADALGVKDRDAFWHAIEDGDYEFMATRPLDLGWMVNLWNAKRALGTYLELIDAHVSYRLRDVNPSYQQAGASLSVDMLRRGVEQLAAATEFSGQPFVSTTQSAASDEVAPNSILSDWQPLEVARLIGSAVFDEATFGRVKFHHRSIREYLAASWVDRQLRLGLPLHRVLPLFSTAPFGLAVLIPARRATLCWLAALNVDAREWVARRFPEMLLFEGDPEAWDLVTANLAFTAYIEKVEGGFRTDWWNDASEFRRLARRLPPGRVAQVLAEQKPGSRVIAALLPLIKHGRLVDSAPVVFEIYRRPESSEREKQYALVTLAAIGSLEHRAAAKEDLLQGRLQSNELIGGALAAIDLADLSVADLTKAFTASRSEPGYGPMARTIKEELLPRSNRITAEVLLTAVIAALPSPKDGKRFARFPETEQPERAWLLEVLPDCTERLFSFLSPACTDFPEVCIEAAERIEALRDSGFADREDQQKLHALIKERSALRWKIALEIAQSEDIRYATSRLTWEGRSLVYFSADDLPELTARANDHRVSPEVRGIWFELAINLAFRELRGRVRHAALAELSSGLDEQARTERLRTVQADRLLALRQRRQYETEERKRKADKLRTHECNRENLIRDIEYIRDGSRAGLLHWLISYSYSHSGRETLTRVSFSTISRDFGADVSEALASGLAAVWQRSEPPNPADYPGGQVPWDAITSLAGVQVLLDRGTKITEFSAREAARAARLAVWELNGPPWWFENLATVHMESIVAALDPWLQAECTSSSDARHGRGALELALRSPAAIRKRLLQSTVELLKEDRIPNGDTFKSLLDALRQDELLTPTETAMFCRTKVEASLNSEQVLREISWLRMWIEEDLAGAWAWFERYIADSASRARARVEALAAALVDSTWVKGPVSLTNARVLVQMHRVLHSYLPVAGSKASTTEDSVLGDPIARLRESIVGILVQTRGEVVSHALTELASQETELVSKQWLHARVGEHAALEAQHFARVDPARLKTLSEPFLSDPRSERELFQQVIGRLEEIRETVEEGPFSDRLLFSIGMPEKHLQLWLASRLLDTTNRRFSVHREEVVDADKRTDVQLSCQYGSVCVEIKPLDKTRKYSVASLVDTMRTQMVGQYLKGFNSTHGILVLCRLDEKRWAVPGESTGRDFRGLVTYLKEQARLVRQDHPQIDALEVFGIDCVG